MLWRTVYFKPLIPTSVGDSAEIEFGDGLLYLLVEVCKFRATELPN